MGLQAGFAETSRKIASYASGVSGKNRPENGEMRIHSPMAQWPNGSHILAFGVTVMTMAHLLSYGNLYHP